MKPTTAIKQSLALVGPLYQIANNWAFLTFDPFYNVHRESTSCNYWQAYGNRRVALIESALSLLFPDHDQYLSVLQPEYRHGRWQDWVWKIYRENT
jgi:hypothetical protein